MIRWQPGQAIGPYQLEAKLGEGAFAEVWRAVQENSLGFRKKVALKLLIPSDDRSRVEGLLQEARLCANLRHPNIVDVFEVGIHEDIHFVAMEYVDGGTLASLIDRVIDRDLQIPPSVIVEIGVGIGRALAQAHTPAPDEGRPNGIIHRDLKPANILLSSAGAPKVADFGLAKAGGDMSATATGMVKGTPAYVAPEIWRGEREFRPPVDLFALGCILFELVLLKRLVVGGSIPEIFGQVTLGDPSREAAEVARICPSLAPIVELLLQRDPALRYPTARRLIEDLEAVQRSLPVVGSLEGFLDLLQMTEAPPTERKTSSSAFSLPVAADAAWREVIRAAIGEEVQLLPPSPAPGGRVGAISGRSGTVPEDLLDGPPRMPPPAPQDSTGGPGPGPVQSPATGTESLSSLPADRIVQKKRRKTARTRQVRVLKARRKQQQVVVAALGASIVAALLVWLAINRGEPAPEPITPKASPAESARAAEPADIPVVLPAASPEPKEEAPHPAPTKRAAASKTRHKNGAKKPREQVPTEEGPSPTPATQASAEDLRRWAQWRHEDVMVQMADGSLLIGVLMGLDGEHVIVRRPDNSLVTGPKADVLRVTKK